MGKYSDKIIINDILMGKKTEAEVEIKPIDDVLKNYWLSTSSFMPMVHTRWASCVKPHSSFSVSLRKKYISRKVARIITLNKFKKVLYTIVLIIISMLLSAITSISLGFIGIHGFEISFFVGIIIGLIAFSVYIRTVDELFPTTQWEARFQKYDKLNEEYYKLKNL